MSIDTKFPKQKESIRLGGQQPANDQKRGNQTITNKAAWHKQTTDIERLQNGGIIKRRPMTCKRHSTFKIQGIIFPYHFEKMIVNRDTLQIPIYSH